MLIPTKSSWEGLVHAVFTRFNMFAQTYGQQTADAFL